jgi:N6-L-threonylcarbamoyladenine synthase
MNWVLIYLIKNHCYILGFLPGATAKHHQACVLTVLREALDQAKISPEQIDAIAYTKGL